MIGYPNFSPRQCPGCCCLLYWIREGLLWCFPIHPTGVSHPSMHGLLRNNCKPTRFDCDEANQEKKMIISNLIPFTRLNLIFAFGILISAIIKVFERSQIGVPKLSIQVMVMLLCLLLTNQKAKMPVKYNIISMRGINLFPSIEK